MISAKKFLFVLMTASALFADGFIIFPGPAPTPLYVKYHKVRCAIDNGVATTVIDQVFVNPLTTALAGGTYIFPIPKNAAITGFSVIIDDEAKPATVMTKTEARVFFNTAIKTSTLAALLEYTENGAYSLKLASIAPGASQRIQISYVEVLPKMNGLSRYLYPLNTEKHSMRLIDTVSIAVSITNASPIMSVFAPSFPIVIQRTGISSVTASYVAIKSRPDRDFDLYYKLSDSAVSFHMFTYKKSPDDGYFLMLMTPRFQIPSDTQKVIAKDMAFTIDHSGSMAGVKLQQAKDALTFCLNRLMPDDYFNIVLFDNTIMSNATELLPATSANLPAAHQFVQSIVSGGSTDIALALTTSLSRITGSGRPHYLIFLTDGLPTAGVTNNGQISDLVNAANADGTRLFSVGFGYDVNTVLIDKLSLDNGGYPLYCSPDQNIEEVVGDLYKRIEAPILTSPVLTIASGVETYGISPAKLPDLFANGEIAVYGRYKGQGPSTISLAGIADEQPDTLTFAVDFPDTSTMYPFVPRLWATQQISRLMTRIKLQTMTQEALAPLVDSVKMLSLAYGIVTPYTAQIFTGGSDASLTTTLQTSNGKAANDASNSMQSMQQNSNAAQTVATDTNTVPYTVAPQTNQLQNAGNKVFVYESSNIWVDASYDSTKPADTVYYGTDAYFELAAQSPELLDYLSVGNQVAFTYQGKNYLVIDKNRVAGVAPDSFHPVKPSLKAITFNVMQRGAQLLFTVPSNAPGGSITIYSVRGSAIMNLPVESSRATVEWSAGGRIGCKRSKGTFVAVYRNENITHSIKFIRLQ